MKNNKIVDWIIRFIKGMFIGTGAILPGVSGGALAAVFGIYERMIEFLANLWKDFWKNVLFFIPVGLGGIFGFFILSIPLVYLVGTEEVPGVAVIQTIWCFIGCILGTMPSLYKEAGKEGRKPRHLVIAVVTAILVFAGLLCAKQFLDTEVPLNFFTWIMAGAIFALGAIVPGLSPSNFLIYLKMYGPLMQGVKDHDLSVIIPVGIGGVLCVLGFAKLMKYILKIAYANVFHVILGVVVASTAIIAFTPDYSGINAGIIIVSSILFLAGLALGLFMGKLEAKYKHE
ncbi:MAG: DUF368 domain-containing protein [Clostridiaceae bacterium]|nr:DUF368 domain-containing protein [Clostridiaceae bacterium]